MKRGEMYWVNFDPQVGSEIQKTRPAVIVGDDTLNAHRRTVVVVPLTLAHTQTLWPVLVAVDAGQPACACIDQVKACDKRRFADRIGALSATAMDEISDALRYVLGL